MKTIVSIIIPIYNMSQYLDECVRSVLSQTYKNYELLLIDDGSTDDSGKLCDYYADKYSNVRTIHKKNGGLVSAWKRGVGASNEKASYILFIDPDDFISANYLDELLHSDKNNSDIIISKICKYYPSGKIDKFNFVIESGYYDRKKISTEIFPHMINNGKVLDRGISITRWGKLIKKSLVVKNMTLVDNGITFGEDFNLMIPILLNAKSIYIHEVNNATYYYRIRNDSMLRGYDNNMFTSIKKVYGSLLPLIDHIGNKSLNKQISIDYIGAMILCYKNNLYSQQGRKNAIDFINLLHEDTTLNKYINKYAPIKFDFIDRFILFSITNESYSFRLLSYSLLRKLSILKRKRQE
ncbi:glycosyltransferase family A protein [Limosilactobacillus pontis]|uniref:Glycosyltransferase family A protein n=1 Tax=Limosilactobacillus pontis TaxID=35787 RepID=A0ABU7SU80_9LACO